MRVGGAGGSSDLRIGEAVGGTIRDVVAHGIIEQHGVLADDPR